MGTDRTGWVPPRRLLPAGRSRGVLADGLAGASLVAAGAVDGCTGDVRMLILGGTAWLGGRVALEAVGRGHDVTCLARGESGAVAPGARFVRADRTGPVAYAAVAHTGWDAVLDVSRQPGQVRGALSALAAQTAYLAFVSTASVYADDSTAGADETAALLPPLPGETMADPQDYGPAKVACERAVLQAMGTQRCLVARAGLLGGPGDWSDRSGYWPARFERPATGDGSVVVPDAPALWTQLLDVRGLAAWLVDCCERQTTGIVNAVGDALAFDEHLAVARQVAGHSGPVLRASPDWLTGHGVQPWMGPRSLPLWLPLPQYAGHGARDGAAGRALGLRPRPLAQTLGDTLAWERARDPQPARRAGLTDSEAAELVTAWRATHPSS
ncbi:MAG: NAD-dependent epimerase/dehydratase family protein [Dermatophilaceae bacterium]